MKGQPWTLKYKPKKISSLVGNKAAISRIAAWLKDWPKSIIRNHRGLILFGPSGVGKTLAVYTIATEFDYEVYEINASVKRSKKAITDLLKLSTKTGTLTMKRGRVVLIDELEGLSGKSDRGAASAINAQLALAKVPIILITNDITDPKIRPLRKICTVVEFEPITEVEIVDKLKAICTEESLTFEESALEMLASNSRADLRAAINDLQNLGETGKKITCKRVRDFIKSRDLTIDITKALERIFYADSWSEAISAANQTDAYPDELIRWISNNIPLVYPDLDQQEKAWEYLSRASIFNRRITLTQNWRLLPYSKQLMSISGSLVGGTPSEKRPEFHYPEWIRQMGFSRGVRQKRSLIGQTLSPIVHLSSRKAYDEYKILLKVLIKKPEMREEIQRELELPNELIQFLMKD
ncbi:MAG: replication factor C large subunit [Promethearchaeota archaeon]